MEPAPHPEEQVTPRVWLLALTAGLACAVGLAPYLLFVDALAYLGAAAGIAVVLGLLVTRKLEMEARAHPSPAEWLLGAWGLVAMPAGGSLVGLLLYAAGYWLAVGAVAGLGSLGVHFEANATAWGFRGSVWFVAVAAVVGATVQLRQLAQQLYPTESWSRSAFYSLRARRTLLAGVALAVVGGLAAGLWFFGPSGVALPALSSVLLFYSSIPLARLGEKAPGASQSGFVDLLAALLQSSGYQVVRRPRTGKSEIDPLLQRVDLLAKSRRGAFAFDVKAVAAGSAAEWKDADAVQTAALLLSEEIVDDDGARVPVNPVLVVLGGAVSEGLALFAQRESVPVVHCSSDEVNRLDRSGLAGKLQGAGVQIEEGMQPMPSAP